MTSVSIHIVTYNSEAHIKKCLQCVLQQTYKKCSVLVIDNASLDETAKICRSLGVRVVRNKNNTGYSAAHNQALQLTQSTYVLTLNPDVFLSSTFVYYLVKALDKDQAIGSACGLLYRIDNTRDSPKSIDGAGLYMEKNRRQRLRYEGEITTRAVPATNIFGPDGAAAFYRRAMLEDIAIDGEVFDEDFFMHKEDVDVVWRAQRAGWKSLFVPLAKASHIRTFRAGFRHTVPPLVRRISLRNRYLLLMKNDEFKYFWRDLVYILIYEIKIFCYAILFERPSLNAYKEAYVLRQKMNKKRKIIERRWPNNRQAYKYFY